MTEAEIITPNHPRYHGIHSPKITFDNKTHKILKWEHVRTASDRRASAAGALARAGNAYLASSERGTSTVPSAEEKKDLLALLVYPQAYFSAPLPSCPYFS